MLSEELFNQLKKFDPDLCALLKNSLDRQINTLSLIPTDSAASPLSQYLKGSALGNDFIGHNSVEHYSRLEKMAVERVCKIFKAEHAIIRIGNAVAASRVVLQALAKPDDNILSFNLRKKEHCTGSQMQYFFIKFALEPNNFLLNFDKLRSLALLSNPKIIIYSPVNYPHNIEYQKLRKIADEVNAYLWVDLGQNAGLIAAGKIPSPVQYADVATFAGSDGLHGPQSGIILCKKKLADILEKTVIQTGHASLKKNVMAALAITFKEVLCEEFEDYAETVMKNARALEKGLQKAEIQTICSPTENHLVLVKLPKHQSGEELSNKLMQADLLVKAETLMTSDENIRYPILRLSSLDPTTRSLDEDDMFTVGLTLGEFLKSSQDSKAISSVRKIVKEMVENLPLFSEEWLPESEIVHKSNTELMMKALIHGM